MICAISICKKEQGLALGLFRWMVDLGQKPDHDLVICLQPGFDASEIVTLAQKCFKTVDAFEDMTFVESEWGGTHGRSALGPNNSFSTVARQIEARFNNVPFLWIECDCTPIVADWIDVIASEYGVCKKPFMGAAVNFTEGQVPSHMSGVAVYHHISKNAPLALNPVSADAWDVLGAPQIVPRMHSTNLIQHEWLFDGEAPAFPDKASLSKVYPSAVLFHRCKDQSLIARLRENLGVNGTHGEHAATVGKEFPSAPHIPVHRTHAQSSSNPPNTIFTYFHPLESMNRDNEERLIYAWQCAWTNAGWNTVALCVNDAVMRDGVDEYSKILSFPSSNPKGYDEACWLRWFAMRHLGGWMCDYDVFPVNFKPFTPECMTFFSGNERDKRIPCLVYGSKEDYAGIVNFFMSRNPTGDHYSDMIALNELKEFPFLDKRVLEYGELGWTAGDAIHFATGRMQPAGKMPKYQHIPELIKLCGRKEVSPFDGYSQEQIDAEFQKTIRTIKRKSRRIHKICSTQLA